MITVPTLPSDAEIERSAVMKFDSYYAVSREVECVIQRLDKELPEAFLVRPWTLNRAISLFRYAEHVGSITFEYVEDCGVVPAINLALSMARIVEVDRENG